MEIRPQVTPITATLHGNEFARLADLAEKIMGEMKVMATWIPEYKDNSDRLKLVMDAMHHQAAMTRGAYEYLYTGSDLAYVDAVNDWADRPELAGL